MKIKIVNIDTVSLNIDDLGIILQPGEYTYLDHFKEISILESVDLKDAIESLKCEVYVDNSVYNYSDFLLNFENITTGKHDRLDTLTHNLYEDSFMKTTKEYNQVKYITYFTDSTMTAKTREEEIVRDENGRSIKIINRVYDNDQNIVCVEEQILNRNIDGKVESITLNRE